MQAAGWVGSVRGRLTAVDADGNARQLWRDAMLCMDETLVTALDGAVSICLSSGAELYLAPGRVLVLDADVVGDEDGADDGRLRLADVRRVLSWGYADARRSMA